MIRQHFKFYSAGIVTFASRSKAWLWIHYGLTYFADLIHLGRVVTRMREEAITGMCGRIFFQVHSTSLDFYPPRMPDNISEWLVSPRVISSSSSNLRPVTTVSFPVCQKVLIKQREQEALHSYHPYLEIPGWDQHSFHSASDPLSLSGIASTVLQVSHQQLCRRPSTFTKFKVHTNFLLDLTLTAETSSPHKPDWDPLG